MTAEKGARGEQSEVREAMGGGAQREQGLVDCCKNPDFSTAGLSSCRLDLLVKGKVIPGEEVSGTTLAFSGKQQR